MTETDQPQRRDPLVDIAEAVDALINAQPVRSSRGHEWVNGNKKPLGDYTTTIPGLIQRLRDLAQKAGTGGGTWGVPDSRPPLELDPVSLVAAIEYGAAKRILDLGQPVKIRPTAEGNLSALVDVASRIDSDRQRVIASEVRSWRHQAEILCNERARPVPLVAPCPARTDDGTCGQRTLFGFPDTDTARCVACGYTWSETETPTLFDHIRTWTEQSKSRAAAAREQVRATKAARTTAELQARRRREDRGAA